MWKMPGPNTHGNGGEDARKLEEIEMFNLSDNFEVEVEWETKTIAKMLI